LAKNRHKRHEKRKGEEIARNLIEYRVYVADKEVPCVRLVYGYTLMEADPGETIENIAGGKGRYAILEYGEDPCWNYEFVLYVSDNLSILRPIFEILCNENYKDLIESFVDSRVMLELLWKSREINDIDRKVEA